MTSILNEPRRMVYNLTNSGQFCERISYPGHTRVEHTIHERNEDENDCNVEEVDGSHWNGESTVNETQTLTLQQKGCGILGVLIKIIKQGNEF